MHYQNPRMIVGCLAVKDDRILLCKRSIEPGYGLWNLPAGFLEKEETVEEGAARETREEALTEVAIDRLFCVYNLPHANQVYLHFLAELTSDYAPGPESLEVELFKPDEIPWGDIAFSSTTFALEQYLSQPDLPHTHIGTKHYS